MKTEKQVQGNLYLLPDEEFSLNDRYRPKRFDQVVGNEEAVRIIKPQPNIKTGFPLRGQVNSARQEKSHLGVS